VLVGTAQPSVTDLVSSTRPLDGGLLHCLGSDDTQPYHPSTAQPTKPSMASRGICKPPAESHWRKNRWRGGKARHGTEP
jgi:hypothetical protein